MYSNAVPLSVSQMCHVQLLFGDCGQTALEDIKNMSSEVMVPLIRKAAKQAEWSEILSHQITDNAHKFATDGISQITQPQCLSLAICRQQAGADACQSESYCVK